MKTKKKATVPSKRRSCKSKAKWDELPLPIIHHIQSILPLDEAAKTGMLSKAWHSAWSTIPTLRFYSPWLAKRNSKPEFDNHQIPSEFEKLVVDTLEKYARNNLLVQTFELKIGTLNQRQTSVFKQWLQEMLGKNAGLRKLTLFFWYQFPFRESLPIFPPVHTIECRFLLVLELYNVHIDEETIHKLLSTCLLIEEISLSHCQGFCRLVVKNFHRLRLFRILLQKNQTVEVDNLPSLQSLALNNESHEPLALPASLVNVGSENLRSLDLIYFTLDTKGLRQFVAKFPFLECLTIGLNCPVKRINITNDSLRELCLYSTRQEQITDIIVHSPVLCRLSYHGCGLPAIFLPNIKHNQLHASFGCESVLDNSCFLRLREIVKISSKLEIRFGSKTRLNIDLDDLKEATVPSDNVEELSISSFSVPEEHFPAIVDALFSVCHPKYIRASRSESGKKTWDKDFCKFLLRELMERAGDSDLSCCTSADQIKCWRHRLQEVQVGVRRKTTTSKSAACGTQEGELVKLAFPWRSLFDGSKTFRYCLYFKLKW